MKKKMFSDLQPEGYIYPYTSFGFKLLFGTELNKELLISFVNSLLNGQEVIKDLTYLTSEQLGSSEAGLSDRVDAYCVNEKGEKILVEVQRTEEELFEYHNLFYSTCPISKDTKKGGLNYNLKAVYVIGILNFVLDGSHGNYFNQEVERIDAHNKGVFYDKLTYIYLEMPKFKKTEEQLDSLMDKWLYVLRNLVEMSERPAALQEPVFDRLFESADLSKMSSSQRMKYEYSLMAYRDWRNCIDFARKRARERAIKKGEAIGLEKGEAKGREEERKNMILTMLGNGATEHQVCQFLDITPEILKSFTEEL